ncbi:winged helix DNA-binding domain-containing protein [Lapillicoccus jejuensis]|uniref:Winged helix DNA-binding protein n=1 Tax=Lapillicoccus jejuensis TaxID=402171 RepID=A0A542E6S9_9MICO|nr:winged helix DNA-binding domain-containing protein [Lapillicoccus jejuensis]TQJ11014.1 winged helix DNA-binding protein [Lapillicoccus jejuensis]
MPAPTPATPATPGPEPSGRVRREVVRRRLAATGLAPTDAPERAEAVVGSHLALQAQDLESGLWSVGSRSGLTREQVVDAWAAGTITRTWPMRGTLHLVAARDAGWLTGLLAGRAVAASARRRRDLGLDEEVTARARRTLVAAAQGAGRDADHPPLTRPRAYDALRAAGIDPDGQRGVHLLGLLSQEGLLVQGPPQGRDPTFVLHDEWVLDPWRPDRDEALATLATRYVRRHGPVGERDLAGWTGLPLRDVRAAVALAGDVLAVERVAGRDLLVHVDAPTAGEGGVVLAAPFDELVLGYKERWALLTAEQERVVVPGGNGMFLATVVVDGAVRGTWGRRLGTERARVTMSPWDPPAARTRRAVEEAVARYGAFLGRPVDTTWAPAPGGDG